MHKNADVLTTRVANGIAVITLGSPRRIYFDAEMGDALTEALDQFAGDANIRVVVVTGGAPGYFNRHFDVGVLIGLGFRYQSCLRRQTGSRDGREARRLWNN